MSRMTPKEIGDYIKQRIEAMGYTQGVAAARMNFSLSYLNRVIAGQARLSAEMAFGLTKLNIPGRQLYVAQAHNEYDKIKDEKESPSENTSAQPEIETAEKSTLLTRSLTVGDRRVPGEI